MKKSKDTLKPLLRIMRVSHYSKNVFIIVPVFFSGQIVVFESIFNVGMAFVLFSLVASAIYIFNDYCDIDSDQLHPIKKYRPLVSGQISIRLALSCSFLILTISLTITGIFLSYEVLILFIGYVVLNFLYSYYLKRIALLDITIIAIGFILRLFVGSLVSSVDLSKWIVIMTFLLSLFLALTKRRDDVVYFLKSNEQIRVSLNGYNLKFIDSLISISASVTIISYIIYTISNDVLLNVKHQYLYLTSFFVILGFMNYLQITFVQEKSASPVKILFYDRFTQINLMLWVVSFTFIIYF